MTGGRKRLGVKGGAGIIVGLFALDQWTKWMVTKSIEFEQGERVVVPGFFSLVYWGNTGAAFSSFTHNNGMFIGLSAVTLAALGVFAMRGAFQNTATRVAVCLLSAGVLGNVTDRVRHHYVVDMLLFNLHARFADPWPAFNVADSCICVAAFVFVITAWVEERKAKPGSG